MNRVTAPNDIIRELKEAIAYNDILYANNLKSWTKSAFKKEFITVFFFVCGHKTDISALFMSFVLEKAHIGAVGHEKGEMVRLRPEKKKKKKRCRKSFTS